MENLKRLYICFIIHTYVLSSSCLAGKSTTGSSNQTAHMAVHKATISDKPQFSTKYSPEMATSSSSKYLSRSSKPTKTHIPNISSTTEFASLTPKGNQPSSPIMLSTTTASPTRTSAVTTTRTTNNTSKVPTYIGINYPVSHSMPKSLPHMHVQSKTLLHGSTTMTATTIPTDKSKHISLDPSTVHTTASLSSSDSTWATTMSSTVTHYESSIHPIKSTSSGVSVSSRSSASMTSQDSARTGLQTSARTSSNAAASTKYPIYASTPSQESVSTPFSVVVTTKTLMKTPHSVIPTKQESVITPAKTVTSYSSKPRTEVTPTIVQTSVTAPGQTTITSSSGSLATARITNIAHSTITHTKSVNPSTKGYFTGETEITPTPAAVSNHQPEMTSPKKIIQSSLGLAKKDVKYVALGSAWGFVLILFIIITIVVRRQQRRKREKIVLDDKDPETLAASFHMKNAENLVLQATKPARNSAFKTPAFSDPAPEYTSD